MLLQHKAQRFKPTATFRLQELALNRAYNNSNKPLNNKHNKTKPNKKKFKALPRQ